MRLVFLCGVLLSLLVVGCGSGRSSVTGKITYEDGTPVSSGMIIGEGTINGKMVSIQGTIQVDGSYSLGGEQPGDGAMPGQYKVILMPISISDYQASLGMTSNIDGKYGKYDSSGLSLEVKPGPNEHNFTISKPKTKAEK